MNFERLANMVFKMVVRKLVGKGVDHGIRQASGAAQKRRNRKQRRNELS